MLTQPDSMYSSLTTPPVRLSTVGSDAPTALGDFYVADRSPSEDPAPYRHILIVDDHPMYRSGLESLVRSVCPTTPTVAVGTLGAMADEIASGKRFECIFLDLDLPDSHGISSVQQAKLLAPDVPIFVLSGHISELVRNQCLNAGAARFIGKTIRQDELIQALQALLTRVPDKALVRPAAVSDAETLKTPPKQVRPVLSARQLEILVLIAEGRSNEEISVQLNIALGTVKAHVSKLLNKLDVKNRQAAAAVLSSVRQER